MLNTIFNRYKKHFLRKLKGLPPLPKYFVLCTVDIVGLYPNIPHSDGLDAIQKALDNRSDMSVYRIITRTS